MKRDGNQTHRTNISNPPVVKGVVEDTKVKLLRDSGCSGLVVHLDLVHPNEYINALCLLPY